MQNEVVVIYSDHLLGETSQRLSLDGPISQLMFHNNYKFPFVFKEELPILADALRCATRSRTLVNHELSEVAKPLVGKLGLLISIYASSFRDHSCKSGMQPLH